MVERNFTTTWKKQVKKQWKAEKKIFFKPWKMHLGQKENKQKFRDPYKSLVPSWVRLG